MSRCLWCHVVVAGPALPVGAWHVADVSDCGRCSGSMRVRRSEKLNREFASAALSEIDGGLREDEVETGAIR